MGNTGFKRSSFFDENLVDERRKTQRYKAGSFLEIDSLCGSRKVVMIGRDGVTYWDSINADKVTPLVIHPVLKPQELGSLVHFIRDNELTMAAIKVVGHLSVHMDARKNDSLFIMRTLWNLAKKEVGKRMIVDDGTLQWALKEAEIQESDAVRVVHENAQRYNQVLHA